MFSSVFVVKGLGWMPWHMGVMKDVGGCDKPRGAVNRAVIRGCLNEETHWVGMPSTQTLFGGVRREVKHLSTYRKRYSVSSGERKRRRPNRLCVILVRGCMIGVVGCCRTGSDRLVASDKTGCELNRIECLAVEGDGPVGVNALSC